MRSFIGFIIILILTSCGLSPTENAYSKENLSEDKLYHNWDSDAVLISHSKIINREISSLTNKKISGVFYDNEIATITAKLDFGTCLADLWDGAYIYAVAFTDTNTKAFMVTKYNCIDVENWLCYGDCEKLLSDKKIIQTIKGRNGWVMIRRRAKQ